MLLFLLVYGVKVQCDKEGICCQLENPDQNLCLHVLKCYFAKALGLLQYFFTSCRMQD